MKCVKKILSVLSLMGVILFGFIIQRNDVFAQTISPINEDGLEIYVYDPHAATIKVRSRVINKEVSITIYDEVTSMQYDNSYLLVSEKFCYKIDKNSLKISSDAVENCRAALGGEGEKLEMNYGDVVSSTGKRVAFGKWEINFGDMTYISTNGRCRDSLVIRNVTTGVSSPATDAGKCFNDGEIKSIYGDSRYDQFVIDFTTSSPKCYDIKTLVDGTITYSQVSNGDCKVGKTPSSQTTNDSGTTSSGQSGTEICENMNIPKSVRLAAGCDVGQVTDVREVVINIVLAVLRVLGLVCVIVVIVGGVTYMTSRGEQEKIKKAKNTILYALIGLSVCALAFAIVNFIASTLNNNTDKGSESEVAATTTTTVTAPVVSTNSNNAPETELKPETTNSVPETEPETKPEAKPETEPETKPEVTTTVLATTATPKPETEPEVTTTVLTTTATPKPETVATSSSNSTSTTASSQPKPAAPTTVKGKLVNTINSLAWPYTSKKADRESRATNGATSAYVAAARAVKITDGVANEPYYQKSGEYKKYKDTSLTYHECRLNAMSCAMFVGTVYRYSGVDPSMGNHPELIYERVTKNTNLYEKVDMKSINDAQGGDIAVFISNKGKARHVEILTEVDGKIYTAKGSVCLYWPFVYKKQKLPTPGENDDHIEYFRHK